MESNLRIVMAQVNMIVGDIEGNAGKIITDAKTAYEKLNADLIIFPELALTGYPPEDLLLRPELYKRVNDMISKIKGVPLDELAAITSDNAVNLFGLK